MNWLKNKLLYISLFFFFTFSNLIAQEKINIIQNLEKTQSLVFDFVQITNELEERGECTILFPGKMKCFYKDKKQKELIINNKKLAIIQKRYNKIYFYPIAKSSLSNILEKKKLIEIIKSSEIKIENGKIYLTKKNDKNNNLTVLFDRYNYNLNGWIVNDTYNNKIIFLIKIKYINKNIKDSFFKFPS